MAPSLAPPMTPSPGPTPGKRPRRMVPIIPAIPRSLEKRKVKEDLKSSEDGGASGSPIRPTGLKGPEDSHLETATTPSQAAQDRAPDEEDVNDEDKDELQETRIETAEIAGSEEGVAPAEVHAQGFEVAKNGFRLPSPSYPRRSPPPAISTDVSSANEKAEASDETSQTVEEESGSNISQQSPARIHVTLNAAAPTFHAHPTPPTDVTTSPAESSSEEYDTAQTADLQQEPSPPIDDTMSPIQLPYEAYEVSQNISFYAPPQSSDDLSSPNHSIYQGYAYAPTSYDYSPESHVSQQRVDSPQRAEFGVSYEQRYDPHVPYYNNHSSHPILGSQPPLTPSRTPLDPSAQPWSYSNGPAPTVPISYGYVPPYDPQLTIESLARTVSQEPMKSEKPAESNGVIDDRNGSVRFDPSQKNVALLIQSAWRALNESMSSHVPLVDHLLQHFNVEEYADCTLTLIHENGRFEKTTWSLSSLLLAQSYKLRDLLRSASLDEDGKISLQFRLTDRFVTPWAMNLALRVLYGERPEMFLLAIVHGSFAPNAGTWVFSMDSCLAFAAAGHVLGLESVVLKGLQLASSILDWDNLEHALSFALESGPNRRNSASADVVPLSAYSPMWSREGGHSTTNLTPPSASTESRPERSRDDGLSPASSHLSEVRSAWDLQTCCLQWMTSNLDDSWDLDPSARPLAEVDRLPTTAESRSPLFKSRLSRIQFGDHPSEMHAKASNHNFLVSSIVLSLPFTALKYILNLGSQPLKRHLPAIVKERERRRQIVLQSKSVPWSERLAAREHEWAEVGYTEWVEASGDGRVSLARTFTGIDRQVSEPSTPGQPKK